MHSRVGFVKSDWFIRGGRIFDINEDGEIRYKDYGKNSSWRPLKTTSTKQTLFLTPKYSFRRKVNSRVMMKLQHRLKELWNKGTPKDGGASNSSHTQSNGNTIPPHLHLDRTFHLPEYQRGAKIKLLGQGVQEYCTVGSDVDQLHPDFQTLFQYLKQLGFTFEMLTMRRAKTHERISVVENHKGSLGSVAFVPLKVAFWTILEVSNANDDSLDFWDWLENEIDGEEVKKQVLDTVNQFCPKMFSIYYCRPGTVLAFQAHKISHATIIPPSTDPRELCILFEKVDN